MAPLGKIEIKYSKLLLAEGIDAKLFFIWACQAFDVHDVQVIDFGGINNLTRFLQMLKLASNFETVTSIVIARDAETNPVGAIQSVRNSLEKAGLPVPETAFQYKEDSIRTAFMVFPGFEHTGGGLRSGTLEDLCLDITKDPSTFECVDAYITCLRSLGQPVQWPHKMRLHTFLAGKGDFVGMKIGEASRAGAWDWDHEGLERFRDVVTRM